jgi:predicted transglutaminase-like cysteine proteinase
LAEAPPIGFQLFCLKNDCSPSGAASVPYTAKVMDDLAKVTKAVNGSIRYRAESGDKWSVNVSSGDCEDYALTKRARLMKMGYPASALRMAVGHVSGVYHAVLVVKTKKGAFVLDNLTDEVLPVGRSKIRVRKMASADPMVWG